MHISQTRKKTGSIVSEPGELEQNTNNNNTWNADLEAEEKQQLLDMNLRLSTGLSVNSMLSDVKDECDIEDQRRNYYYL